MDTSKAHRLRFSLRGLLVIITIGGVLFGMFIRYIRHESARVRMVEKLEADIQAQIPPISNRIQAEAWFKSERINCTYEIAEKEDKDISGIVRGSIDGEDPNMGFIRSGWITVYFFFDHDGKCASHWID